MVTVHVFNRTRIRHRRTVIVALWLGYLVLAGSYLFLVEYKSGVWGKQSGRNSLKRRRWFGSPLMVFIIIDRTITADT